MALGGQWLLKTSCNFEGAIWMYLACNLIIVVYVLLWLPESQTKLQRRERMKNRPSGLGIFIQGIRIFVGKQYSRWRLWFALFGMFIFYLNAVGATSINTLYLLHGPLAWNLGIIGVYQSISEFVHGIALIVLLSFLVIIALPDALIVLLRMIWATALFTAQGLVRVTAQMFVGELLGLEISL